jgi:hypothetical protein
MRKQIRCGSDICHEGAALAETGQPIKPMKILLIAVAALALAFCGCAATSVKQTWKSPSYHGGPVGKIAVVVMTDRDFYRKAIENHFAGLLTEQGQSAFTTHDLFNLSAVKADRPAAVARLRQAGADSVLVVRLVDSATYSKQTHTASPAFTSSAAESYGYLIMGSNATWNSLQRDVYLESSLYELASSERLWSGVTRTVLKEDTDTVAKIEPLAKQLFALMRQDGVIH